MAIDKRAGQPAQQSDLINVAQLTAQYYVLKPEVGNAEHAVKFGTSGHRGSAARHKDVYKRQVVSHAESVLLLNDLLPSTEVIQKLTRRNASHYRTATGK